MRRLLAPELGLEKIFLLAEIMFYVTEGEWDQMRIRNPLELSPVVKQGCSDVRVRNNHNAFLKKEVDQLKVIGWRIANAHI